MSNIPSTAGLRIQGTERIAVPATLVTSGAAPFGTRAVRIGAITQPLWFQVGGVPAVDGGVGAGGPGAPPGVYVSGNAAFETRISEGEKISFVRAAGSDSSASIAWLG